MTNQSDLIARCVEAALDERIFPAREFETLIGVSRETLQGIASEPAEATISNIVVNLLGYQHGQFDFLEGQYGLTQSDLNSLLLSLT